MLEKPDIPDDAVRTGLKNIYDLDTASLRFLPIGADLGTGVYRVEVSSGTPYFLKLRKGAFDPLSVELPAYLLSQGITQIIPVLPALDGSLWNRFGDYTTILYPFIDGKDGYQVPLTGQHWIEFGAAVRKIQSIPLPDNIANRLHREDFTDRWRKLLLFYLGQIKVSSYDDPVSKMTAEFLKGHASIVLDLLDRADRYARQLQSHPMSFVLCHSDLHAGNLFISGSRLYIVDWDAPLLAPKERDLMYAGGGQFGSIRTPQQEEQLFYQGYGPTQVNPTALTYYRFERIIEDLAVECEQIFKQTGSLPDREQAFHWMQSNFEPGNVLDIALRADIGSS